MAKLLMPVVCECGFSTMDAKAAHDHAMKHWNISCDHQVLPQHTCRYLDGGCPYDGDEDTCPYVLERKDTK